MANENYPRLCGGTFFTLLLQSIKQRRKTRDRYNGGSDGLSDPDVLIGLIRTAQPQYKDPAPSTFSQNTSAYKSCSVSSGAYLPFNDSSFTDPFDKIVKTEYMDALTSVSVFIDRFIDTRNTAKCERLVKAIIELIDADKSIVDSDLFYIGSDGQPVKKSAIRTLTDICLQSFILGVWHYIVMNRPDNTIGRGTFEQWHEKPDTKGKPWRFFSNIGENVSQPIRITMFETEIDEANDEREAKGNNEPFAECDEQNAEDTAGNATEKATNQVVNNPFVFNQYGNNNVQIASIDNLTVNNG